jgi:hypothetical protein
MERKKIQDAELLKALSKVSPKNIVRINLSDRFGWPELRKWMEDQEKGEKSPEERWGI